MLRDTMTRIDFKNKKDTYYAIRQFKEQKHHNELRKEWESNEKSFQKFEQRMKDNYQTIEDNERLTKEMKKKEVELIEKLNNTVHKQSTMSLR